LSKQVIRYIALFR